MCGVAAAVTALRSQGEESRGARDVAWVGLWAIENLAEGDSANTAELIGTGACRGEASILTCLD